MTLDEGNGEATASAGGRITPDLAGAELNKPSGFTPRYVLAYLQTNPLIKRRFVVGDQDVVDSITASGATLSAPVYANADGSAPTAATWVITAYRGEKIAVAGGTAAADTGLNDGD
ncbi:MAG: hypothetical protein HC888_08365 [Candidatus Competibacteraceae bacterium]|nr:hypothetical protein [Candidatus Competibacteraceae bacterium]